MAPEGQARLFLADHAGDRPAGVESGFPSTSGKCFSVGSPARTSFQENSLDSKSVPWLFNSITPKARMRDFSQRFCAGPLVWLRSKRPLFAAFSGPREPARLNQEQNILLTRLGAKKPLTCNKVCE